MRENNVNVQVYSSCNCDCNFCMFKDTLFNRINPDFVLNYLKEHPEVDYIVLTGGEPTFAIEECSQIIQGIDNETKTVVLQTNGWWGNNNKVKDVLKANPPSRVHLSVDSEKQKLVSIDTVLAAFEFLSENNIPVSVVNHTTDNNEFGYYSAIFEDLHYGKILTDDGNLYDCGTALLATNKVSTLNIKGWGGDVDG